MRIGRDWDIILPPPFLLYIRNRRLGEGKRLAQDYSAGERQPSPMCPCASQGAVQDSCRNKGLLHVSLDHRGQGSLGGSVG